MRRLVALVSVVAVLVLGIMTISGRSALAQDATPAACPTTTEEENAALITQLREAVDAGADVSPFFAQEHVAHGSNGQEYPNNGPRWFSDRQEDFPDLTVTSDLLLAQDDMVADYITWSGTQQGAYELIGAPATGQPAEWTSIAIFRIECGKIVELWPISDNLDLLMDVGVITEEELQSAESMATPTS